MKRSRLLFAPVFPLGALGRLGLGLPAADGRHEYAHLVEQEHGHGHEQLGDHVGRRQDGGNDEDEEHRVAAEAAHALGGDDAHAGKEEGEDGHLEDEAEGQDELDDEVQVVADLGHGDDLLRGEAHKELEGVVEDDEVAEKAAAHEEHGRDQGHGDDEALLLGVEARRDESPDLVEDEGAHHEEACHEGDEHAGEEGLGQGRVHGRRAAPPAGAG